ncbi:MAG: ABC transporter ATP-binding protein [Armatimonadetes bacterium]|nr:ABC transporter ATP-binding protein [Armatimonadota bacterium]
MASAIEINELTKVYKSVVGDGRFTAVDKLNLTVDEGQIFGFLGPNGAGKTTTIKMLLGLIFPTSGSAKLLGKPIGDISTKNGISYLPETPYFYDYMTGPELLDFYGRLFRIDTPTRKQRIERLIDEVGLGHATGRTLRQYSKGMLQRIGIAQALINDPKLLFFDEPTSGLDPVAHIDIRNLILRLKDEGKTLLISSHQLSDVEMVCDRVAIIHKGQLKTTGHVMDLITGSQVRIQATGLVGDAAEKVRKMADRFHDDDGMVTLWESDMDQVDAIVDAVRTAKGRIVSLTPERRSLEDIFIETVREAAPVKPEDPAVVHPD